jgi:hypothetical protein
MEANGQLHTPAALPLKKQPRYPLYRGLVGPQIRSGNYGEEKNLMLLPTIEPDSSVVQLVA